MDSNRDFARGLKSFDAVWRRVRAGGDLRSAAEGRGVPLMPRRQNGRRRCCRGSNLDLR